MSNKFVTIATLLLFCLFSSNSYSGENKSISISDMMTEIKKRSEKFNWDTTIFTPDDWKQQGNSVYGRPLIYWTCGDPKSTNSSLVLSAVHGDEITPVYFGFRFVEWMKSHPQFCKDSFVVVAPIVNPDGFLRYTTGTRTNYNKVDLNRNFNTPDWSGEALKQWNTKFGKQQRYFPGHTAESEPETIFQKWLISEFKPNKILSVHAPLNVLDYDGPLGDSSQKFSEDYVKSCEELRKSMAASSTIRVFAFGTFPGSLGNYAGKVLGIPTFTVELPTANHTLAGSYFANMENGLKAFLQQSLRDVPRITKQ